MKEWLWSHAKLLIGVFFSTLLLKSGGMIGRIFGTLGLALIAYKFVMPEILAKLQSYASLLDSDVYNLITYTQFDKAMVMVISAGAVKLTSNLMLGKAAT